MAFESEILTGKKRLLDDIPLRLGGVLDGFWNGDKLPSPAYEDKKVRRMAEVLGAGLVGHGTGIYRLSMSATNYLLCNLDLRFAYYHNRLAEVMVEGVIGVEIGQDEIGQDYVQFRARFYDSEASLRVDSQNHVTASLVRPEHLSRQDEYDRLPGEVQDLIHQVNQLLREQGREQWDLEAVFESLRGRVYRPLFGREELFGPAEVGLGSDALFEDESGGVVSWPFYLNPQTRVVYLAGMMPVRLRGVEVARSEQSKTFFKSENRSTLATLKVGSDASLELEIKRPRTA